MGFFKKIKKSVKKRVKKVTKGAVKVAKTASGVGLVEKYYDKNKKSIKDLGKVATRAGAAYLTAGASEGLLAVTGNSSFGLDKILGSPEAEAFIEGYNEADYVDVSSPSRVVNHSALPASKISPKVNSNLKKRSSKSFGFNFNPFSRSQGSRLAASPVAQGKSMMLIGGIAAIGVIGLLMTRGRK